MGEDDYVGLLPDVLDKLIKTQVQTAQVTADLKNVIQETNQHLNDVHKLLMIVNSNFSNGFRAELKDHISQTVAFNTEAIQNKISKKAEEGKQEAQTILKSLKEFIATIKSPKTWISAFFIVVSFVGTIAAVVTIVLKMMGTI